MRKTRVQMLTGYEGFPVRLKRAREFCGMTQGQLADLAQIPASSISHFEKGTRSPSWETFRSLCYALRVDSEYLICRSDSLIRGVDNKLITKLKSLDNDKFDLVTTIIEGFYKA